MGGRDQKSSWLLHQTPGKAQGWEAPGTSEGRANYRGLAEDYTRTKDSPGPPQHPHKQPSCLCTILWGRGSVEDPETEEF